MDFQHHVGLREGTLDWPQNDINKCRGMNFQLVVGEWLKIIFPDSRSSLFGRGFLDIPNSKLLPSICTS